MLLRRHAHPISVILLLKRFSEQRTVFPMMASASATPSASSIPFPLSSNSSSLEPTAKKQRALCIFIARSLRADRVFGTFLLPQSHIHGHNVRDRVLYMHINIYGFQGVGNISSTYSLAGINTCLKTG